MSDYAQRLLELKKKKKDKSSEGLLSDAVKIIQSNVSLLEKIEAAQTKSQEDFDRFWSKLEDSIEKLAEAIAGVQSESKVTLAATLKELQADFKAQQADTVKLVAEQFKATKFNIEAPNVRVDVPNTTVNIPADIFTEYKAADSDTATSDEYHSYINKDGKWFILRVNENNQRYTTGLGSYSKGWSDRVKLTYKRFDQVIL